MDDNLSIKSTDSVTTSGEYEIVPEELESQTIPSGTSPTLNIANNGNFNDLEKNLTEVIHELDTNNCTIVTSGISTNTTAASSYDKDRETYTMNAMAANCDPTETKATQPTKLQLGTPTSSIRAKAPITDGLKTPSDVNKVGQSVFYDCLDLSPMAEKQDDMKPERSDTEEEMSDIDQDCTIFSGVTYLGAAKINAPKSEIEILRNISEMNACEDDSVGLKVAVSIPSCSEGFVVLHDSSTHAIISHYEVNRILFYFRGPIGSTDQACFAFTWQSGDTLDSTVFQCHIFRCNIPEAVNQVSSCFSKAFQPLNLASMTTSVTSAIADNNAMSLSIISDLTGNPINSAGYEFIVSLQIREKLTKNSYTVALRDRSCFKLRCNADKEINITVNQEPSHTLPVLHIERCFGVLLSPGKLVRQADMQLLDMVSMGYSKADQPASQVQSISTLPYTIRAEWKANDKNFERLNLESTRLYITVAVDLVIRGIQEPVRFVIETPVAIQAQSEIRLMDHFNFSGNKKSISQRFYLQLKDNGEGGWEVSSIDPSDEILEPLSSGNAQASSILKNFGINSFSKMVRSTSAASMMEQDESPIDYSSDGDEPLLSGTGDVPKDCPQDILKEWDPIIQEWDNDKRPKNLTTLVRLGIPEALRDNMWQRLANVENKTDMIDQYRVLLTKETKCETVIQRDINRTFPAHKFFREIGGSGQDALFKVSKAYAVYDNEVGYCQGLSFIAASLLLHMPEEEAFCVLVALMYDYGLRDLYKDGFEMLYLRLYQLNRLIKDQLPKLYEHFEQTGVETHMFASQWFLTLFTARFPLYLVFHILDVFLLDGMQILFQVALTLLTEFENELRTLDFEGILKYFRVTLPKRCRSAGLARKLMKKACDRKVKKLKVYRDEFLAQKELAEKEEMAVKQYELRFDEERKHLKADIVALQTKLEQTEERSKLEEDRKTTIIDDYKQIIQRQEQQITKLNDILSNVTNTISNCSSCSSAGIDNASLVIDRDSDSKLTKIALNNLGPLDPLENALKQVKELELGLAQTKLELVESQCRNQDLNHQMNTLIAEIQSNRNSWQPWLAKTINSIQEKERNQVSPNMRPKNSMNSLSSTGRHSLDFTKTDISTANIISSNNPK